MKNLKNLSSVFPTSLHLYIQFILWNSSRVYPLGTLEIYDKGIVERYVQNALGYKIACKLEWIVDEKNAI